MKHQRGCLICVMDAGVVCGLKGFDSQPKGTWVDPPGAQPFL